MKVRKEKIAYAAGLVDGEGYIGIIKSACWKGEKRLSPKFEATLTVTSTNKEIISWLIEHFGGYFHINNKASKIKNWKTSFKWRLGNNKVTPFLLAIYPFLIIKKKQAKVVLEFLKKRRHIRKNMSLKVSTKEFQYRNSCFSLLKKLNFRGLNEKESELLGNPERIISSQAEVGILRKVQRLETESRTDNNVSKSALPEKDDIVRTSQECEEV